MSNIALVRVHEREQVEQIISEAVVIATMYACDTQPWRVIFEKSCDLLAARIPVAQPSMALPIDLNGLKG